MMNHSASDGFRTFSSPTHESQLYWANRSSPPVFAARSLRGSTCFMRSSIQSASRTKVQQDDVWSMDEHGIGLSVCNNSRVLGVSGKRKTYIQSPENRGWVSILECISASGRFIRPLAIFKAKMYRPHGLPKTTSPTG